MKKLLALFVVLFALSISINAQQKEKKIVDLTATKMKKSRGDKDPNIIQDFVFNAPDIAVPKPEKSRGSTCTVNTVNKTGYTVYVYIDGYYKGYVNPWSQGAVTVGSGYTTVYVKTSGGTYYWKDKGNCDFYYNFNISI